MCAKYDICESVFELSGTQVKTYGSGTTDMKPIYPQLSSGYSGSTITPAKYALQSLQMHQRTVGCSLRGTH